MAKNTAPTTSTPIDVAMPESLGVLSAWQPIFHLLNGRVESWEITPENGVVIHGLTMTTDFGVDPQTVITAVNQRERRTQLLPSYFYVNGGEPAHYNSGNEITQDGVAFFKGDSESGTSGQPDYFKAAAKAYKASRPDLAGSRRGPKTTRINLKDLTSLDPSVLENASIGEEGLETLAAAVAAALGNRRAAAAAVAAGTES